MPPKKRPHSAIDPDEGIAPPRPKRPEGPPGQPRRPTNTTAVPIDLTRSPPNYSATNQASTTDVTVKLNLDERFQSYPDVINQTVLKAYKATVVQQIAHLNSGTLPNSPYRYSIVTAHCVRPTDPKFTHTTIQSGVFHRSVANLELLKYFLEHYLDKRHPRSGAPAHFVGLEPQEGSLNPEFVHLHSVRCGEVGWGFDAEGCLSLYVVGRVERTLVSDAWFVQRGVRKVEDKSEEK